MASVVDKPKKSSQSDLLEIEKYTNGLIKFIESSATPITIGVQGEWGSGKTSLLNTIKEDLCDKNGAKHFPIWINTWEYSLLSSPDETLMKIVIGLVDEIGKLTKNNNTEKAKKALALTGTLLKNFGGAIGGVAGKGVEIAGKLIEDNTNESQDNSIKALRNALQIVVDEAIETNNKSSFIFFIDDLDRLEPSVAVSILELIKNLFDLENCVFILAIDYGVVVKGLQSKFGVLTEENEWEFRAFFDKIIQLPFSMPISNYNISKYLQSLLVDVNYFSKSDLEDEESLSKISEIVGLSVGTNPRTLKRLANSVSLIEIIRGEQVITSEERIIEFALICIQIAYPFIYGLIQKESDFTNWSEQLIYNVVKNNKIDDKDLEALKNEDEFDEEWEQNLWRMCQVSSFLKQRTYQLSKLLNFIKDNIPKNKDEDIGETLDRLLSMSSVTSVSADNMTNTTKKKHQKTHFDTIDDYLIEKSYLPNDIVEKLKNLLNDIMLQLEDDAVITYSPSAINIKTLNSKNKMRAISYIRPSTKKIHFSILDRSGHISSQCKEVKYDGKFIGVELNDENNFDYERYVQFFKQIED